MNNDLKQFSEERLKLFELKSKYPTWDEISALARIALAVKQAKIAGFITSTGSLLENETQARANIEGTNKTYSPFYTTPQPAHTDQSGWIECSLRMPENNPGKWSIPVAVLTDTGDVFKLSCMGGYWQRTQAFIDCGGRITHWMSLPY